MYFDNDGYDGWVEPFLEAALKHANIESDDEIKIKWHPYKGFTLSFNSCVINGIPYDKDDSDDMPRVYIRYWEEDELWRKVLISYRLSLEFDDDSNYTELDHGLYHIYVNGDDYNDVIADRIEIDSDEDDQ